ASSPQARAMYAWRSSADTISIAREKMESRLGASSTAMVELLHRVGSNDSASFRTKRDHGIRKLFRIAAAGLLERGIQPGPAHGAVALGRRRRDAQASRGLLQRQAGKVAELDQLGLDRLLPGQRAEGVVQGEQVFGTVVLRVG